MIKTDRKIFEEETEIKPNKYSLMVLAYTLVGVVFCWILNEMDIFLVEKKLMRIGSLIPIALILIPLILTHKHKKLIANHKAKYFILVSAIVLTLSITTLLFFHTTIMLLYPLFIASFYRSEKMGRLAAIGSIFCAIVSPLASYMLNLWDVTFFTELVFIQTGTLPFVGDFTFEITQIGLKEIFIYLVIPRIVSVSLFSMLELHNIHLGQDHVKTQIELNRISQRDALTGLYNQNCYKEYISSNETQGKVGVLFFDVNGLKEANDTKGHEYGDLLLAKCSESIRQIVNDETEYGFRIGGDEFVAIFENATEETMKDKLLTWQKALQEVNEENRKSFNGLTCSMASGYAVGDFRDIESTIKTADTNMYQNKLEMKKK